MPHVSSGNERLMNHIDRSLIASYLGNIVGALLVGIPALYFYAPDYQARGVRDVEAAEIINGESGSTDFDDSKRQ